MGDLRECAELALEYTRKELERYGVTAHCDGVAVFPTSGGGLAGFSLRFEGTTDGRGELHNVLVAQGDNGNVTLKLTDEGRDELVAFLHSKPKTTAEAISDLREQVRCALSDAYGSHCDTEDAQRLLDELAMVGLVVTDG